LIEAAKGCVAAHIEMATARQAETAGQVAKPRATAHTVVARG